MKITRITKIRHRIFRDFMWPDELQQFGQFNVIYGWNGSGKTTLSSLVRHMESRSAVTEGEAEFEFDDATRVRASDFATINTSPVRVFNRDFVADTILAARERMEPIYFLGKDSVEKQKQVETLRQEHERASNAVATARSQKSATEKALDDFCINKARVIKDLLISTRSTQYNNYDKRRFKQAADELSEESRQGALLEDEDKERLRKQKDAQPKNEVAALSLTVPPFGELASTADNLWKESVVSQALKELTEDREVGVWVQRGLALHSGEHATDTCRFCGKALLAERRKALEAHFNDAFSAFQAKVDAAAQFIEQQRAGLAGVEFSDASRLYDHLTGEYESAVTKARASFGDATKFLESLHRALLEKRELPFKTVSLSCGAVEDIPDGIALTQAVAAVNAVIAKHNTTTNEFQGEVDRACTQLEKHYIAEAFPEYDQLRKALQNAEAALGAVVDRPKGFEDQIASIEHDIVEHRRPAEELNAELRAYLAHDELRLDIKDTGYTVMGGGQPANDLSESEKTAIAFLYFLKSLQDKTFDLANGIVVIDDPVSSLDANSLFSAFGYMKERTRAAGQLFVLTHNFGFFRQVRNWFQHLPHQRKKDLNLRPGRFYLLRAYVEDGRRTASLGRMDPLLEQYESEYHYLFKTIHDEANRPDSGIVLQQYYGLPNIARRLLEAFLAFRHPDMEGDLSKQLDQVSFDSGRKTRILRLLHTYSHAASIADPEHDPTVLSETKPVLRDVLELMKSVDRPHYEAMLRLVSASAAAE